MDVKIAADGGYGQAIPDQELQSPISIICGRVCAKEAGDLPYPVERNNAITWPRRVFSSTLVFRVAFLSLPYHHHRLQHCYAQPD